MAKSKKSKILAMALCASVMTGIYAAPVMAAGQVTGLKDSTGAVLTADDTVYINGVELSDEKVNAAGGNFTQLTVTSGMVITGGGLTVGDTKIDFTTGNTVVGGTLTAAGAASLNGGLTVNGDRLFANKGLTVTGAETVIDGGRLFANEGLTVSSHGILIDAGGDLSLADGNVDVGGNLNVNGETTLKNTEVNGTLTAGATTVDSLGVTNNATVGGTLEVTGETTLKNGATVQNGLTVRGGATVDRLGVTNNATVGGTLTAGATDVDSLTVNTDKFVVDANGNTTVGGTLDVTGETTLAGLTAGATDVDSLTVNTDKFVVDANGNTTVGGTLNVADKLTANNGLKVTNGTETDTLTVTGAAKVDSLEVDNGIKAAKGTFQLTDEGVLTVGGKATFTDKVTVMGGLSVAGGASVDGNFAVTNGGLAVTGGKAVLNDGLTVTGDTLLNGNLNVGAGNFKVDTAGNTEFNGNLNIGHGNFTVDALTGDTVVKGSLNLGSLEGREVGQAIKDLEVYADELKGANLPDKVGGIERDPASAGDPGNGTTTIESGAEFTETAMTMGDTIVESGKITVGAADDQTIIEGGAITAKSLMLDGKDVGKTITGIERDPENEVTTIEGATSFDANGMSIKDADGFGTSLGVAGMDITAAGGLKTSFTAGGATFVGASGTTTINGGAIETTTINGVNFTQWHDEVDGRLDKLEDKTQNIKPGAGTGTGTGEGGTAAGEDNNIIEVPDTEDGHTGINGNVTVGGEINAGAGNIGGVGMEEGTITAGDGNFTGNVDITGDINAGTGNIGGVGMEEGTITTGDTAIDGSGITTGNGNFTGNVDITGGITAGTGDIGGIGMAGGTITTGDTTIDGNGMTVGEGTDIKDGNITVKGDEGKVEIGKGDVTIFDENGEKVTSIQHNYDEINRVEEKFDGEVNRLDNRITKVEDRIDKVGAMSAAIANLRTMGYDPAAPTEIAVGVGQYRSETGVALGMFHYPNKDFMLSLSVSTSGDEVMGGIGATWKFGRKSPEKVLAAEKEKAAKAKLAKAEAMKKAAKEAKIKAQQERHAKLAAERAAQAEAAK